MKSFHSLFKLSLLLRYEMAVALALLILLFFQRPAYGQTVTSSLSGTVADTSGASVPDDE